MGKEWGREGDIFWKSGRGGREGRGGGGGRGSGRRRTRKTSEGTNENQCAGLEGWKRRGTLVAERHGVPLFGIPVRATSGAMAPPRPALELSTAHGTARWPAGAGWYAIQCTMFLRQAGFTRTLEEKIPSATVPWFRHCFFWQLEPWFFGNGGC